MQTRSAKILEAAVQEFIYTGEPVSSGWLYDHYDFGIKPAMIRLEMEKLADDGFLEQPHHSAGRVPSDKGLEFFARSAAAETSDFRESTFQKAVQDFFKKGDWPGFVEEMSSGLGLLSAASDFQKGIFYKEGLDDLMENFEWGSSEEVKSVVRDFVALEDRLNNFARSILPAGVPQVFIGKSPVTKSPCLSVVMGGYETEGGKVAILAIGPKRMNYKKTIKTFKKLKNGGKK